MYQTFIIPYLYEAQHVSGDSPPIIRSLKLHWQHWTLSGTQCLTKPTIYTSNNLSRMKNHRLPVQF
jgi:hypothetical protein